MNKRAVLEVTGVRRDSDKISRRQQPRTIYIAQSKLLVHFQKQRFSSFSARTTDLRAQGRPKPKLITGRVKMKSLVLLLLAAVAYAQIKTFVPLKRIESVREKLTR